MNSQLLYQTPHPPFHFRFAGVMHAASANLVSSDFILNMN